MNHYIIVSLVSFVTIVNGRWWHHFNFSCDTNIKCLQYCYVKTENVVHFSCCNYYVRRGFCPTGCLFRGNWDLSYIACNSDKNCPMDYKCCTDECNYAYKICKPIVHSLQEHTTTTVSTTKLTTITEPIITTTEPTTTTTEEVITTTTESTTTESTTPDTTPTEEDTTTITTTIGIPPAE